MSALRTFNLSFKFLFTIVMLSCRYACLPVYTYSKHCVTYVCDEIYARVYCTLKYVYDVVVKKFMLATSSTDELLVVKNIKHNFSALHGMPARTSYEKTVCPSVRPSVCLSVKRVDCDKTEERSVQIFIPYERSFSLVF